MRFRNFVASLLAFAFLFTLFPAPGASANWDTAYYSNMPAQRFFPDAPDWASAAINRWADYGVVTGRYNADGNLVFDPNRLVTRAEFITLLVRIMGGTVPDYKYASRFNDLDPDKWYYDSFAIAMNMGIVDGAVDGKMRPDDPIIRQDAITMAGKALGLTPTNMGGQLLAGFKDSGMISSYAQFYIEAFISRGWVTGRPDQTLGPTVAITRADAVVLFDRVFPFAFTDYINQVIVGQDPLIPSNDYNYDISGAYLDGNLLVNKRSGVELRGLKVDGDVIIGEGVGENSVLVSNCDISGRLVIRGGKDVTVSNTNVGESIMIASYANDTHSVSNRPKLPANYTAPANANIPNSAVYWKEQYEQNNRRSQWTPGADTLSSGAYTHVAITDHSRVHTVNAISGFALSGGGLAGVALPSWPADGAISVTLLDNAREYAVVNLDGVNLDELTVNGRESIVNLEGRVVNARFTHAAQNSVFTIANGSWGGALEDQPQPNGTKLQGMKRRTYVQDFSSVENLELAAPNVTVWYANNVRNLLANDAGAVINVITESPQKPQFLNVGVNYSALLKTYRQPNNRGTLPPALIGDEIMWGPKSGTPNMVDRGNARLSVKLLPQYTTLPYALNCNMNEGRAANEVNVTQASSGLIPLSASQNSFGRFLGSAYWVQFFIPAPPEASVTLDSSVAVTFTYDYGTPNPTVPWLVVQDPASGQLGLSVPLKVFPTSGAPNQGQIKETLFINWNNVMTENLQFVSVNLNLPEYPSVIAGNSYAQSPSDEPHPLRSTVLNLKPLTDLEKQALMDDFINGVFYNADGSIVRGNEARRRILETDNPLDLKLVNNNLSLLALNRAITVQEVRTLLADVSFLEDLGIETESIAIYATLSDEGKNLVANTMLNRRGSSGYPNADAAKRVFENAVKQRLDVESSLLNQINNTDNTANMRKLLETPANAAVLGFRTGASPYFEYPDSQKDAMAEAILKGLPGNAIITGTPYPSLDAVINAIKEYLKINPTPATPKPEDYTISRVVVTPNRISFAVGSSEKATLSVTGKVGGGKDETLSPEVISRLDILLTWRSTGTESGSVATVRREGNVLTIVGVGPGSDTLTVSVGGRTATVTVTVAAPVEATGITVSPKTMTLFVGDTKSISAKLLPNNANETPQPTSDVAGIVSLEQSGPNTVVTALRPGVTIVRVAIGNGQYDTCEVVVYESEFDIFISPARITLQAGASTSKDLLHVYTATPLGSVRMIRWTYEDAAIATVDTNGIITANRNANPGDSTVITASLIDRNTNEVLKSATVTVVITAQISFDIKVLQPVVENRTKAGEPYGGLLSIEPLTLNYDLPERFIWNSSNPVVLFTLDGGRTAHQRLETPPNVVPQIVTDGIGRSAISIRTSEYGPLAAEERYIISAPRGVSGMEFYLDNGNIAMQDPPDFGRMLEMVNGTTRSIRATEPGQPDRLMNWMMSETDKYRAPSRAAANHLLSYNLSTNTLAANAMGLARVTVIPTVANLPAGWEITATDSRGRWYGRGNMPFFVATETSIAVPSGYLFNELIDVELSGLKLKSKGSADWLIWSQLNPALVRSGDQIICDVNGRELTMPGDWNPSDVPLVVKTADTSGSNEIFVWIQPSAPTINRWMPFEDRPRTISEYRNEIEIGLASATDTSIIAYEVIGDYTYDTLPEGVNTLTGPLKFAAWTYINGASRKVAANIGINETIRFGRMVDEMPEPDLIANAFTSPILSSYTIRFDAEMTYTTNEGFVNKLDPGSPAPVRTHTINITASNNPASYNYVIIRDPSAAQPTLLFRSSTYTSLTSDNFLDFAIYLGGRGFDQTILNSILALGPPEIESDNPLVVSVAPGIITAVGVGNCNLTVIHPTSREAVVMPVQVIAPPLSPPPSTNPSIVYNVPAVVMELPGVQSAAQSAGIDAASATFSSDATDILVIDSNGVALPVAPGTAGVTITGNGKTARTNVTVTGMKNTAAPKSISLRSSATVTAGASLLLLPYLDTPNADLGALVWTTSNAAVAAVDQNGFVTGLKAGKATVKVSVTGTKLSSSCTVTVAAPGSGVASITLNKPDVTISAGKTSSLTVKYAPSNAIGRGVTWVSSDETVARVSPSGVISGIGAGTAVITATCDVTGVTAQCKVTVYVAVSKVALNTKTLTMNVGGGDRLTYTVNPENATDTTVTWKSSNTKAVTVDSQGNLTAVGSGTATVTVTTNDGKKTDTCRVTVKK